MEAAKNALAIRLKAASDGVVDINEKMLQAELFTQMMAQRLYPVTLGGMMPRRYIGDAGFLRQMKCLFRHFTADIGINLHADGLLEVILRRTSAPGDTPDRLVRIAQQQRCAPQHALQMIAESL